MGATMSPAIPSLLPLPNTPPTSTSSVSPMPSAAAPSPLPAPSFAAAVLAALAAGRPGQDGATPPDIPPAERGASGGKGPRDAARKPAAKAATAVCPTTPLATAPIVIAQPVPLTMVPPGGTAGQTATTPTQDTSSVVSVPARAGRRRLPAATPVAVTTLTMGATMPTGGAATVAKVSSPATPDTQAPQVATRPLLPVSPDAGARVAPTGSHATTAPEAAATPHGPVPEARMSLPPAPSPIAGLTSPATGAVASVAPAPAVASTARAAVAQVSSMLAQLPRPAAAPNATTITLHLAPPALGDVAIRISAPHGAPPVVTITPSHQTSAEALAAARPNLEASLLRAGLPAETRVVVHPPNTSRPGGTTAERGFRQQGDQPRRPPPPPRSDSETDFAAALDISA